MIRLSYSTLNLLASLGDAEATTTMAEVFTAYMRTPSGSPIAGWFPPTRQLPHSALLENVLHQQPTRVCKAEVRRLLSLGHNLSTENLLARVSREVSYEDHR